MRPDVLARVAPQIEEPIRDRGQTYARALAVGTREAANGGMRVRAVLASFHVGAADHRRCGRPVKAPGTWRPRSRKRPPTGPVGGLHAPRRFDIRRHHTYSNGPQ